MEVVSVLGSGLGSSAGLVKGLIRVNVKYLDAVLSHLFGRRSEHHLDVSAGCLLERPILEHVAAPMHTLNAGRNLAFMRLPKAANSYLQSGLFATTKHLFNDTQEATLRKELDNFSDKL